MMARDKKDAKSIIISLAQVAFAILATIAALEFTKNTINREAAWVLAVTICILVVILLVRAAKSK